MAFELLAERLPWPTDRGITAMLGAVLGAEVPSLRTAAPALPDRVHALIERALEKRPERRLRDMDELLLELERAIEHRGTNASGTEPNAAPAAAPSTAAEARLGTGTRARVLAGQAMRARPTRKVWGVGTAAITLGLASLGGWLTLHSMGDSPGSRATSPTVSAAQQVPSGTPMRVVDWSASASRKPQAAAAYKKGLQAVREAAWERAHRAFESGAVADPECPEVALRLVMTGFFFFSAEKLRQQYAHAVELRAGLGQRDRHLLGALEPGVRSPDQGLFVGHEALVELASRYPRDAELLLLAIPTEPDVKRSIELANQALAGDPEYVDAWQVLGGLLSRAGRSEAARHAYEQCLRHAPGSGDCLEEVASQTMLAGRCRESLQHSEDWVALAPLDGTPVCHLALALGATGAASEATTAALDRWAERSSSVAPDVDRACGRARLAALRGDFQGVRAELATMERESRGSRNAAVLGQVARLGIDY